ncbi:SRPBCC domain-containing protein [Flavobacterium sp. Sd200]|nr:SRPBCC domain-containing protein [Flavobacterium sp. Sd200]MXN92251.1 SRPBCC domain-containing protein [Flavobacterium sp. Sd200]
MKSNLLMNFTVDKDSKKVKVEREFAASVEKVWAAWTQKEILDQWWAPKPWKAETKTLDFTVGGYWLYAMVGPEGEKHWARADYKTIDIQKSFSAQDAFCDEDGNVNTEWPRSVWTNTFNGSGDLTNVTIEITYDELADLEKTIEMGFKEGFTAGLENLDEVLERQV